MTLRDRIQEAIKDATKARAQENDLRPCAWPKGPFCLKKKQSQKAPVWTDAETIEALRAEVKEASSKSGNLSRPGQG